MAKQRHKSKKHFQIEKTKRNVFAIVVIASIVLSTSIVLGKFVFDWSRFNLRVISAQTETIEILENNIENAEGIVNEYRAFEGTSNIKPEQILDALPAEYDLSAWNSSLQFIVGLNSLSLETVSGDDMSLDAVDSATDPQPQEFEFGVEVSGDYSDIRSFINDVNRSIRPIALDQLNVSGNQDNITLEATGRTFYQPAQSLEFSNEEVQ